MRLLTAKVVAEQVQGDGVDPGLRAALARIEGASLPQHALERVRGEVLGQSPVAGAMREKSEERLRMLRVEVLELVPPHLHGLSTRVRLREPTRLGHAAGP